MDKENLTWRTFADPGAISAKWNAGPATYYSIDTKGLIRYKPGPIAKDIDAALEGLIHETGKKEPPKPLPKALVEAWTELGANVCWLRVDELGYVKVIPQKEGKPGDLPGFNFVRWQEGWLAKLPAPDAAFGLHLGRTEVSDAGLKELAR